MINLVTAQTIVSKVLFVFVYFISTSLNGYIQAKVANKFGDTTPEEDGFMTLNPMAHIDFIGFLFLLISNLGWGKFISFNPNNVHGKWRMAKIFLMHSMETIISLIIAIIALIICVGVYGLIGTQILLNNFFINDDLPIGRAANFYHDHSSLSIVIALFLMVFVFFNIFIAVLSGILNGFRFALIFGFERGYKYVEYTDYLTFLAPLLVIFFFANFLRFFLWHLIMWAALKITILFGIIS